MKGQIANCVKCALPISFPGIRLNSVGECNFCEQWHLQWDGVDFKKSKERLLRFLEFFRGKGDPYDCIIGLSGGTDSSYLVYLAKSWGMTPLTVTFDNGFLSEGAKKNISALKNHFSFDHTYITLDEGLVQKMFLHFLLNAGEFCSVCNIAITTAIKNTARAHNIRLVLSGHSPRTEPMVTPEFFTCTPAYFDNVCGNIFSEKEKETISPKGHYRYGNRLARYLNPEMFFVKVPNFVPWNDREIVEILSNYGLNFNLFNQHADCLLNNPKEYLKFKKFGVLEFSSKLSSLVRDGQITREDALRRSGQKEAEIIRNERMIREKLTDVFGISEAELESAILQSNYHYLPFTGSSRPRLKNRFDRSLKKMIDPKILGSPTTRHYYRFIK